MEHGFWAGPRHGLHSEPCPTLVSMADHPRPSGLLCCQSRHFHMPACSLTISHHCFCQAWTLRPMAAMAGCDLRWQDLREQALKGPLATSNAAHAAIRRMLAEGVADPYTRFISPQQLDGMRKYDITAVGLNLGTAEELRAKTGLVRSAAEPAAAPQVRKPPPPFLSLLRGIITHVQLHAYAPVEVRWLT